MGEHERVVLICFAHPDDEAFGLGGTIAVLADRGIAVHVLLATRGEAGAIADATLDVPEVRSNLALVREAEARAAAGILGARDVRFLGYPDGGLVAADAGELTVRVTSAIRQLRPAVVITFGPEGIYGHPDHVAIGEVTTEAFRLAADAALETPAGPRHAAARLFYQVITAGTAAVLNAQRGPVRLGGADLAFVGYADHEITTRIDVTGVLDRKMAGLACHRTQTGGQMDRIREWLSAAPAFEHLILARSRVPDAPGLDADPLAGIG